MNLTIKSASNNCSNNSFNLLNQKALIISIAECMNISSHYFSYMSQYGESNQLSGCRKNVTIVSKVPTINFPQFKDPEDIFNNLTNKLKNAFDKKILNLYFQSISKQLNATENHIQVTIIYLSQDKFNFRLVMSPPTIQPTSSTVSPSFTSIPSIEPSAQPTIQTLPKIFCNCYLVVTEIRSCDRLNKAMETAFVIAAAVILEVPTARVQYVGCSAHIADRLAREAESLSGRWSPAAAGNGTVEATLSLELPGQLFANFSNTTAIIQTLQDRLYGSTANGSFTAQLRQAMSLLNATAADPGSGPAVLAARLQLVAVQQPPSVPPTAPPNRAVYLTDQQVQTLLILFSAVTAVAMLSWFCCWLRGGRYGSGATAAEAELRGYTSLLSPAAAARPPQAALQSLDGLKGTAAWVRGPGSRWCSLIEDLED